MENYIEIKRRAHAEEHERRRKMQDAAAKMDMLAIKLGKWNPQATIRSFRDANREGESR